MRLRLDTRIWRWTDCEPRRLTSEVHQAISDAATVYVLSSVSIGEAILLLEKRKIDIKQDFGRWLESSRTELELREIRLNWRIVHELRFTILGYLDRRIDSWQPRQRPPI